MRVREEVKKILKPYIAIIERNMIDDGELLLYNGLNPAILPYRELACIAKKYGLSPGKIAEIVRDVLGNAVGVETIRKNISAYYYNGVRCQ